MAHRGNRPHAIELELQTPPENVSTRNNSTHGNLGIDDGLLDAKPPSQPVPDAKEPGDEDPVVGIPDSKPVPRGRPPFPVNNLTKFDT